MHHKRFPPRGLKRYLPIDHRHRLRLNGHIASTQSAEYPVHKFESQFYNVRQSPCSQDTLEHLERAPKRRIRYLPGSCPIYLVQSGDTCAKVAKAHNLPLQLFYVYHPTVNSKDCSNLLSSTNVCVDKPAGPRLVLPSYAATDSTSNNVRRKSQAFCSKRRVSKASIYYVNEPEVLGLSC